MASFMDFIPPEANVKRGGRTEKIEAVNLVPGDIVVISGGDKIPADIRIISANSMKVDNSSLTARKAYNSCVG